MQLCLELFERLILAAFLRRLGHPTDDLVNANDSTCYYFLANQKRKIHKEKARGSSEKPAAPSALHSFCVHVTEFRARPATVKTAVFRSSISPPWSLLGIQPKASIVLRHVDVDTPRSERVPLRDKPPAPARWPADRTSLLLLVPRVLFLFFAATAL